MGKLKSLKRCFSLLLAMSLVLSMMPIYASETDEESVSSEIVYTSEELDNEEAEAASAEVAPVATQALSATFGTQSISAYSKTSDADSVMFLTTGGAINGYYFDNVADAFAAVNDPDISGDVTLQVIRDSIYTIESDTVNMFSGADGKVALDMNGKVLSIIGNGSWGTWEALANINASHFIITDSKSSGSAITAGRETVGDKALTGGALKLENVTLQLNNKEGFTVENVKIEVFGATAAAAIGGSIQTFEVKNASVVCKGTINGTTTSMLNFTGNGGSVSGSVIKNAGGRGISASGTVVLTNNDIDARVAVNANSQGNITIDGGVYTGKTEMGAGVISGASNSTSTLMNGKFTGNLHTVSATAKIIIYNSYFKGDLTGNGEKAKHTVKTLVTDTNSENSGYSYYTLRSPHTSTVSMTNSANQIFNAATLSAVAGDSTVPGDDIAMPDLQTVYEGETITYNLVIFQECVLTGIKYTIDGNESSIPLTDNPNYTLNGQTATYKMTVPDKDYTLKFILADQAVGTEPVVRLGSVEYRSLSVALASMQDNQTLTLLKDITHPAGTRLEFNKPSTVLDLNGHTLAMDIPVSSIPGNDYSILLSSGSLTVQDSSQGKAGAISFSGGAGIRVMGTGTVFNLQSGTLKDLSDNGNHRSIYCTSQNGRINISGGLIVGRIQMQATGSELNISGGRLEANNYGYVVSVNSAGKIIMTGGEIYAGKNITTDNLPAVSLFGSGNASNVIFEMTGGSITGELAKAPPIFVYGNVTTKGLVKISGNAQITGTAGPALVLQPSTSPTAAVNCAVEITGNAMLKGATYAVEVQEPTGGGKQMPISVTGGHFVCGEDYIPISETYYVTFSNDNVLNTVADTSGTYAGYYGLTTKASLGGTQPESGKTYTYQNYDGLGLGDGGLDQVLTAAALVSEAGNPVDGAGNSKYPGGTWTAFENAYKIALRVKSDNRNANQSEIDFRAAQLVMSIQALDSVSGLDPENLADGTYSIGFQMWKGTLAGLSMSGGAYISPAVMTVKDGKARLSVNLKPTYQSIIWGHLRKFNLWKGDTYNTALTNAKTNNYNLLSEEAVYSNFYAHDMDAQTGDVTYRLDAESVDGYSDAYPHPGTITFDMPYLKTDTENSRLVCSMDVDAMGGRATALMVLNWTTLEAKSVNPTLSLDTDAVTLLTDGKQTVTATLLAAPDYTVTWSSGNSSVATVDASTGEITAVTPGTCTVTVTAKGPIQGSTPITKTVTVTVAAVGKTAVDVGSVTVDNGTAAATLTGEVIITNGDSGVDVSNTTVTVNATSGASGQPAANVTTAKVTIPASAAQALDAANRSVSIITDVGTVALSEVALTQASANLGTADALTLTVAKAENPSSLSLGSFAAAYDLTLVNSAGASVPFLGGTATVSVPWTGSADVKAYYIKDGKIIERNAVTLEGGFASWTTSHFSLWALSTGMYQTAAEIGDDTGNPGTPGSDPGNIDESGFFLSDGNYYVNIALYKETEEAESMGNVAFKNNSRALVTVANGKITNVQVATNPVDVNSVHSAIISFRVPGSSVQVLETESMTTQPAGKNYTYVKRVQFTMPASGQPTIRNEITYVNVQFEVPDTPMDAVFAAGDPIAARLRFVWNTATAASDTSLSADSSTASGTVGSDVLEAPAASLSDSATGVKLTASAGVIPTDAELTVKAITSGTDFTKAETAINEALGTEETPKFKLYDISLIQSKVEIQPNGTITVSIPIPSDYDKAKVVVYRINDDGTATLIKGKVSGSNYEIGLSHLSLYALVEGETVINDLSTPLAASAFTDITGHWAYDAIVFAVENGLFNGTSETTFSPNVAMNRGMFVTVLGRMAGIDAAAYTSASFSDTAARTYYTPYAAWASDNGIVQGVGEGLFAPTREITRQEMATMLNNYVNFAQIRLSSDAQVTFADDAEIASWAKDGVYALAFAEILNGVGEGNYAPARTATRAEVATMLMRFVQNYAN